MRLEWITRRVRVRRMSFTFRCISRDVLRYNVSSFIDISGRSSKVNHFEGLKFCWGEGGREVFFFAISSRIFAQKFLSIYAAQFYILLRNLFEVSASWFYYLKRFANAILLPWIIQAPPLRGAKTDREIARVRKRASKSGRIRFSNCIPLFRPSDDLFDPIGRKFWRNSYRTARYCTFGTPDTVWLHSSKQYAIGTSARLRGERYSIRYIPNIR